MKSFLIFLFFFITNLAFSQVGVNAFKEAALLEVKSINQSLPKFFDGILIPKIDIFPLVNPTIAQDSMLVYLTTEVGNKQPGFYYWYNALSTWLPVGGKDGWDTGGDILSTTDFIGSVNDKNFVFKRLNIESGIIGLTNTSFGEETLKSTSLGINNSALGSYSLNSLNNGSNNTGIGRSSLRQNPNGVFNTALGAAALYGGISGSENLALGMFSLYTSRGSQNVGIGNNSLYSLTSSGDLNTAIAYKSGFFQLSGNKNIIIGANSDVIVVTDSEQLTILKTIYGTGIGTIDSKIGIGDAYPQTKLEVNGAMTLKSKSVSDSATSTIIVGNRSYIKINNTTSTGQLNLSNGLSEGQILYLQYDGSIGSCPINSTANINIAVPFSINGGDMLQFMWDGTSWLLASFSDNN
jgi:trimeric autotransporter adhesin